MQLPLNIEDKGLRESLTSWMFNWRLDLFLPFSYALLRNNDQHVVGHAALSPPTASGMNGPSIWKKITFGFYWAPFIFGFDTMDRFKEGIKPFRKTQVSLACLIKKYEESMWSLEAVAIDPSERGKGLGNAFMNELFKKVVPRDDMIYLATQVPSNIRFASILSNARFYERLGFMTYKDGVEYIGLGKDKTQFNNYFMSYRMDSIRG
jgi:GNAT superfamily N-acetyltransferase